MCLIASPENCQVEETPLHYKWPESRPSVTHFIPCFPYKEENASRTWCVDNGLYSIIEQYCTDYGCNVRDCKANNLLDPLSCPELVCEHFSFLSA